PHGLLTGRRGRVKVPILTGGAAGFKALGQTAGERRTLVRRCGDGSVRRTGGLTSAARLYYSRRISHTSATWQPRPAPPPPGARCQLRVKSPLAVAAAGTSNSST